MIIADSLIAPRQSSFFWWSAYCSGREYSVLNCSFSATYSLSPTSTNNNILRRYNGYTAAAVVCRGNSSRNTNECEHGAVRLGNFIRTPKTIEGRVEICDNGVWAGICVDSYIYWRGRQTRLVCEQLLGHASKGNCTYFYIEIKKKITRIYFVSVCSNKVLTFDMFCLCNMFYQPNWTIVY